MVQTKKMQEDIIQTFNDIRIVYSVMQKLQGNGYRCTPAEGILLSNIMKSKAIDTVQRLRPYCKDVKNYQSDSVPVIVGTFDDPEKGFTLM